MRMLALCENSVTWKESLGLIDRFQNGLAQELYCLAACRIGKVHARSHEIYEFKPQKNRQKTNLRDAEMNDSPRC